MRCSELNDHLYTLHFLGTNICSCSEVETTEHYFISCSLHTEMKWNESGFRPPLCTYKLKWARRISWGWWDDWDDTVLQTQDSKFQPWRSEAENATSRSRRLPTILTFTRGWGRNIFCFFQTAETGNRTPNSGVKGSGANHYPRAPAPLHTEARNYLKLSLVKLCLLFKCKTLLHGSDIKNPFINENLKGAVVIFWRSSGRFSLL